MSEADVDFDYESVLRDAERRAEVGSFSNQFYLMPLRRLLDGYIRESDLNATGRTIQRERVVGILATNLRFEFFWNRHPEIAEERIDDPIVILGFGRTGSTLLQRVLGADPRLHTTLFWEGRFPVPFPGEAVENPEQRIKTALEEVAVMYATIPDLESIHPLDALQAEEEVLLLEQSFYSDSPESFARLTEFGLWRESLDHTPGYEHLKRLLQFLQWQRRRRGIVAERWVLKSPSHIHNCDAILEVFPGVRFVQTHRDPVETIPSFASLCHSFWRQNSDTVDPLLCGGYWAEKMGRGIDRCMRFRDAGHDHLFLDVDYRETARDPLGVAERVCRFIGWEHIEAARAAQTRWLAVNRRDQRPPHEYSPATFGLTVAGLKERHRSYRERYLLDPD